MMHAISMLIPLVTTFNVKAPQLPGPMRGLVSIKHSPWPQSPCQGKKSAYIRAHIPDADEEIGGCGLEVVKLGADGLEHSDHDLRHRAVLSGTLHVRDSYRRQGVAQRLLREAEGTARWWGMDEMILIVRKGNANALRLYKKLGYKMMPVMKEHGGQVCMRKHLYLNTQTLHSMLPSPTMVVPRG